MPTLFDDHLDTCNSQQFPRKIRLISRDERVYKEIALKTSFNTQNKLDVNRTNLKKL